LKLTHRRLEMYMFCLHPLETLRASLAQNMLPNRLPEGIGQDKKLFQGDKVPEDWVQSIADAESEGWALWSEERPDSIYIDVTEGWKRELELPKSTKAQEWFEEIQKIRTKEPPIPPSATNRKRSIELQHFPCNPRIEPSSFRFMQYPWTFQGPTSLQFLASLPFTEASFRMIHREWGSEQALDQALNKGVDEVCYSLDFPPATWALAFQGEGHKRVVSRRWLERGPWYVQRLDNDTTVIYLFDLLAPFHQALPQLQASHQALDRVSGCGYLELLSHSVLPAWKQRGFTAEVIFQPEQNTVRMEVKQDFHFLLEALVDLCVMRLPPLDKIFYELDISNHRRDLQDSDVIKHVQCVFFSRELAEKYLYELWVREVECWWVKENGEEVRLDENYQPPPIKKPDWVAEFAQMMEESS